MSFFYDMKQHFGTTNLYEVLNLGNLKVDGGKYSREEIKKAFFQLSLKFHPDRCHDKRLKSEVTAKFQILSRAYSVLSDPKKRTIYDETGIVDDEGNESDDGDWLLKWKSCFKKMTMDDIEQYVENYKNSNEERAAVKEAYIKHEGDMGKILNDILGVSYKDEDRLRGIIREMIKTGELKPLKFFVAESNKRKMKRKRAAEREEKEAKKLLDEITKKEGKLDLQSMIRNRQLKNAETFDEFCDYLVDKYAKKKKN
ncbi:unnamed protein product [Thelazia callipaeda]|uniref:J domain-containing protein n=1 Tax=Thelazia callipaeda TaxID=103827 RepID=A0A0N5D4B4_THECL|nr:unnamed protein product [Thelazia callipaeda]